MQKLKVIKAGSIPAFSNTETRQKPRPLSELRTSWLKETREAIQERKAAEIRAFFGINQTV